MFVAHISRKPFVDLQQYIQGWVACCSEHILAVIMLLFHIICACMACRCNCNTILVIQSQTGGKDVVPGIMPALCCLAERRTLYHLWTLTINYSLQVCCWYRFCTKRMINNSDKILPVSLLRTVVHDIHFLLDV